MSVIRCPAGFGFGFTPVTTATVAGGLEFGILRLRAGETDDIDSPRETAAVLMNGAAEIACDGLARDIERRSLFDEAPTVLHLAGHARGRIHARTDCEFAICRTENERRFPAAVFDGTSLLQVEDRGRGTLEDTSRRIVRTVFALENRPESNLVLGEDLNLAGRWSSYPPHHHPQPEIYHYRFSPPQGYGHGELGETVHKIRNNDTLLILNQEDHAQVAAPGYAMYYLWVIRHLPGNPYRAPEFAPEHRWLLEAGGQ